MPLYKLGKDYHKSAYSNHRKDNGNVDQTNGNDGKEIAYSEFQGLTSYDSTCELIGHVAALEGPKIVGAKRLLQFKIYLANDNGEKLKEEEPKEAEPIIPLSTFQDLTFMSTEDVLVRGFVNLEIALLKKKESWNDTLVGSITDGEYKLDVKVLGVSKDLEIPKYSSVEISGCLQAYLGGFGDTVKARTIDGCFSVVSPYKVRSY
ncbi:hypothetical protein KQX54_015229 [Cotesia glomerata]|uniref:Uncharacterized protein n=1 Tax=Cotesia glomerata TaxID=32391 RepID=A0AAV7ISR6_COTGL|nr:hypothetical protein KQX54_015229 [Cotesia glomerata]